MNRPQSSPLTILGRNTSGLTLIELLVVILIIGVLATIGMAYVFKMRENAGIATLRSDLSQAYGVSANYFSDNPAGTVSLDVLKAYGFRQSANVELLVVPGFDGEKTLIITATHASVSGVYQVDHEGRISKQ